MKLPKQYALFFVQGKWQWQEKDWGDFMKAAEVKEFIKALCKKHGISLGNEPQTAPKKEKETVTGDQPIKKKRGRPKKIKD
jgi:hypothetical protein